MKNQPTILEAIKNEKLLGRSFKRKLFRGDSWHNWRSFLCALFALPFEDGQALSVYRQCTGRTEPPRTPFREGFIVAGRRSGKSFIIAAIAVFVAAFVDFTAFLSPGEVPVIAIIASDKAQAQILFRYVRAFIAGSDVLRGMIQSDLKETITLKNGIEITVLAGDFRSVRSRTIVCCLLDELAFYAVDGSAASDIELLAALRPAQVTIPNSLLLGISSPYARRGVLYHEWQEHFGKSDAATLVWQSSSQLMNPTISKQAVASAYLRDPTSAASEYGGEFRSDLEGFVSREAVEACIVRGRFELPYVKGKHYHAFADPSGGRSDSMTMAIAHAEGNVAVLDLLAERPAPFSPEQSVAAFAEILKRYRISEVVGDAYSGEWCASSFSRHGINYRHADKNRSELYLDFLPQIMSGQTQLLDDARITKQLCALERRPGRNTDVIDHPGGGHDDIANSVAGVLVQVGSQPSHGLIETWRDKFFAKKALLAAPVALPHARVVAATKPVGGCPQCGNPGIAVVSEQGADAKVLESCAKCGWRQRTDRKTWRDRNRPATSAMSRAQDPSTLFSVAATQSSLACEKCGKAGVSSSVDGSSGDVLQACVCGYVRRISGQDATTTATRPVVKPTFGDGPGNRPYRR
jgi:hypothetical protein